MKPSLVPLYYSSQNPHAKPTFSSTAGAAPPCWTTTVLFAAVQCAIVKPLAVPFVNSFVEIRSLKSFNI
ncbi:hypothetical protein P8452_13049 [Trifolium repens]|nr:hypothetical protein P8452_13049 [Trifolium repens]